VAIGVCHITKLPDHAAGIVCAIPHRLGNGIIPWDLRARSRSVFVKILGEVRDRYGFQLVGYVVMPNHIHLLTSETGKGTLSTVM